MASIFTLFFILTPELVYSQAAIYKHCRPLELGPHSRVTAVKGCNTFILGAEKERGATDYTRGVITSDICAVCCRAGLEEQCYGHWGGGLSEGKWASFQDSE